MAATEAPLRKSRRAIIESSRHGADCRGGRAQYRLGQARSKAPAGRLRWVGRPDRGDRSMLARILAAVAALALAAVPAAAQTLDKIKQRGVLGVGSRADYKPFGFRDPSGAIVGFEPDLAKDVADRLGVKLELEPVVSSNRMQFLQQGKIDLMIATMNVTPERRQTVGIIDPSYYASGVNVLAIRKAAFKKWEELKDQKICGI